MSELTFADSSFVLDVAFVARRLRRTGRLLLVRGPQPQVWRVIEMVGLHRLPGVIVEGPAPAIAQAPSRAHASSDSRDPRDERRLALVLTRRGAARVAADSVLDPARLTAALDALETTERRALVAAFERLGDAGAALPAAPPRRRRRARSTS